MNKHIITLVALLAIVGCQSSPNPVDSEIDTSISGTCIHKYTPTRNFEYIGEPREYKKKMFGEEVWTYEYTLKNGRGQVFLSLNETLNYRCEVVRVINTLID